MSEHAVLSPSAASRWLACTPSARLERNYPDSSSDFADEGTCAHRYAEAMIGNQLGAVPNVVFQRVGKECLDLCRKRGWDFKDMHRHVVAYSDFVLEQFYAADAKYGRAQIFLEVRLDLSAYIPEGFGRGDVVITAGPLVQLIDLKYGSGVEVRAEGNKQLRIYGLGCVFHFGLFDKLEIFRGTIYQPRLDSISEDEVSVAELEAWADQVLKPRALIAFAGEGEFQAGDHCRFCRVAHECRALAEYNLELARHDFAPAATITEAETLEILDRAELFRHWLKTVEAHVLSTAIAGRRWPGYKVVEGRSTRSWISDILVETRLTAAGIDEGAIFEPRELRSPAALEKEIGKKAAKICADLIVKPSGRPTLAPISDKRAEWHASSAAEDFADYAEHDENYEPDDQDDAAA